MKAPRRHRRSPHHPFPPIRFRSIAKSYFRRADGVLLLYDVTCEKSFLNVREWVDMVEVMRPARVDKSALLSCSDLTILPVFSPTCSRRVSVGRAARQVDRARLSVWSRRREWWHAVCERSPFPEQLLSVFIPNPGLSPCHVSLLTTPNALID